MKRGSFSGLVYFVFFTNPVQNYPVLSKSVSIFLRDNCTYTGRP
jgi:hypothetical protein